MKINRFNVWNKLLFMRFTLRQLSVFGAVARHKSMTKAARELHMTQPAVSIQIRKLQDSVGLPLIEITGRDLHLTEAGVELYKTHQLFETQLEAFEAAVSELKGGLTGSLTISAASTAKYFLPYLLGEFRKKFPKIEISLKVTNRDEVLQHLQANEYNLAVLTQVPEDDTIEAIPFLENPLVMCAPKGHPLVGKKAVDPLKLEGEPIIYREKGSGTRMVMEKFFRDKNLNVSPTMELGTNEAVKQAIMAEIGLSLISKLSLENELKLDKIEILDLKGFPIRTRWHALYNKERIKSPVTENFLDFLRGLDIDNAHS